ncbi:unnamed protein product [Thlaspi arvense]|uniref:Uncharacterized protein n=1 Tax=Thlaspi arvense TaxID=13288 RepID=A0AAU9RQ46_THLAR|nr:unnamed protein product [Thlaspi arvense]
MGEDFDGWTWFVEDAFLVHSPDEEEPWIRPPYITKTEKDEPWLTTDEEIDLMNEQINKSLDPADKLIKMFQARVLYSFFYEHEYVFCRPKPNQEVSSGADSVGDAEASAKKPRLE